MLEIVHVGNVTDGAFLFHVRLQEFHNESAQLFPELVLVDFEYLRRGRVRDVVDARRASRRGRRRNRTVVVGQFWRRRFDVGARRARGRFD